MKRVAVLTTVFAIAVATAAVAIAHNGGFRFIREVLGGFEEVPVVSTTARGVFTALINKEGTEIQYHLRYGALQGTVTQSHIHVGDSKTNGGISVWLCSNLTSPPTPPGVQPCPAPPPDGEAEISGTITADDVVGPSAQGFAPGEFDELLTALRAGLTYVNIHSTMFPGGEVRSQIDHNAHR